MSRRAPGPAAEPRARDRVGWMALLVVAALCPAPGEAASAAWATATAAGSVAAPVPTAPSAETGDLPAAPLLVGSRAPDAPSADPAQPVVYTTDAPDERVRIGTVQRLRVGPARALGAAAAVSRRASTTSALLVEMWSADGGAFVAETEPVAP